MGKIILGSSSPRRADILERLKLDFEITPSSYVEPHDQTDFSYAYVEDLAYNKALDVAKKTTEEALVIGADTIVVLDNKILGKPKDRQDAYKMWQNLSGKTHFVVTSIAVINSKNLKYKRIAFSSVGKIVLYDTALNCSPYSGCSVHLPVISIFSPSLT